MIIQSRGLALDIECENVAAGFVQKCSKGKMIIANLDGLQRIPDLR